MIIVGILSCILALSVGPSCSLTVDGSTLAEAYHGGQFRLLRSSHPDSPTHVPGLTLAEKFKYDSQRSRKRAAVLASGMAAGAAQAAAAKNSTFVSSLDNLMGEYGMEITIGTPPRKLVAIADTGSDLVWVQCAPCSNCTDQQDPIFDPTKSSTYEKLPCSNPLCPPTELSCNNTCQYQYAYGDGSLTTGDLSSETLTLTTPTGGTTTANNFAFGCAHGTSGNFFDADGLVGLGRGPLSFTSQLASLYGDKFSYCLINSDDSANQTSPLLFGNSSVPENATLYTRILPNPLAATYFYISLTGIKVNGTLLNISSGTFDIDAKGLGGVIIDSGTTFTNLAEAAFSPLMSAVESLVNYPLANGANGSFLPLCYNLSGLASPTFPVISMEFAGVNQNETFSVDLPEANSFAVIDKENTTCLAFDSGGNAFNIFGSWQQQNFQIVYDLGASQLGFAKVQCNTLASSG